MSFVFGQTYPWDKLFLKIMQGQILHINDLYDMVRIFRNKSHAVNYFINIFKMLHIGVTPSVLIY